jgi:hypothetical protein
MESPSSTTTATADISSIRRSVEESLSRIDLLIESLKLEKEKIRSTIEKRIEELTLTRYTELQQQELDEFLKEPYVIIPKREENEFYVIAPRWLNFQIGWLERQTKSYNIFVVNRYVQWISPVPDALKQKLKFPTELPQLKIVADGVLWTGKEHQEDAFQRYRQFIHSKEGDDRLRIRRGYEFKLISRLIEDGIIPFIPRPVEPSDLRSDDEGGGSSSSLELRSYQTKAWEEFLNKGACGLFWPFGSGKSLFGVYALSRIKGRKLVVVPTLTLKEQWLERIKKYVPSPFSQEITVQTYQGYEKLRDREYALVVFDEVHHLPANTFVRLATLKTKYRLGLSASPFREDRRESYIFALTGFPLGISWDELLSLSVVRQPSFKLYLLNNESEKISKLAQLLKLPLKTVVFCDSIDFGQKIAQKFAIPFVYGDTKEGERLEMIRQSDVSVVSRVGDEGISVPELERVIEVSSLYGSRMQESQRFGRLMHGERTSGEPEHIILTTEEEFGKYQKRFYAITERGFRLEIVR